MFHLHPEQNFAEPWKHQPGEQAAHGAIGELKVGGAETWRQVMKYAPYGNRSVVNVAGPISPTKPSPIPDSKGVTTGRHVAPFGRG